MIDLRTIRPEELRPLKRIEYDRLVEQGCFEDERIERRGPITSARVT